MTGTLRDGAVTLVTGDSRPVEKTYGDGAIDCPWCGAAWDAAGVGDCCPNPGCMAAKWADEGYVREVLARIAADTDRAIRLEREREQGRLAHEARHDADARRLSELRAQAAERGQCDTCLLESDWHCRPRLVRHRRPDFHEVTL